MTIEISRNCTLSCSATIGTIFCLHITGINDHECRAWYQAEKYLDYTGAFCFKNQVRKINVCTFFISERIIKISTTGLR